MTISKDRVKPSPQPDSWKLKEIFGTGIVLGGYLALMTVLFFWAVKDTNFFSVRILHTHIYINHIWFINDGSCYFPHKPFGLMKEKFHVKPLKDSPQELMAALYLQVSIISQALIFVTRSRSWSYMERPGLLLVSAFIIAQLVRRILCTHYNFSNKKLHEESNVTLCVELDRWQL